MNSGGDEIMVPRISRRAWLKRSSGSVAAGTILTGLNLARFAHGCGGDEIKIGFVGCGNRGTGACREALSTPGPVKLVAMGDLFGDRLQQSLKNLLKYDDLRPRIDVPPERQFVGFDAYKQVIAADADLVLLATPPHFRPMHYAAAVAAGKYVFMEKPCCVDAPGYRSLMASNQEARRKRLSVVVGLQRRHQRNYLAGIQKIRDGAVGQVMYLRTYFNMPGGREGVPKPAAQSEMEYQIRHWNLFGWLCGDHLVEQACHEIDVANWVMEGHPIRAQGTGGRQVRAGVGSGDIWDHHAVEFEYPGGVRHFCQARQQPGTWSHVSDNIHGTQGSLTIGVGAWGMGSFTPRELRAKNYRGDNPYQQEHNDLLASVRGAGPYRFEGDYAATSSMTAVMGRMATYSGQLLTWDEAVRSDIVLAPHCYALDAAPPVLPNAEGLYPVTVPGVSKSF
jgi:myo-inositol 2-dehydrogenase / D-chiro-inositol 1-dehydrogenase